MHKDVRNKRLRASFFSSAKWNLILNACIAMKSSTFHLFYVVLLTATQLFIDSEISDHQQVEYYIEFGTSLRKKMKYKS